MASLATMRAHPLRERALPDGEGILPPLPAPDYVEVTLTIQHVGAVAKFLFTVTRNLRRLAEIHPGWAEEYPEDATLIREAEEVAAILASALGARSCGGRRKKA